MLGSLRTRARSARGVPIEQWAAAGLVGAVIGFVLGFLANRGPGDDVQALRERERAEADRALARQARQIHDLETRIKEQQEVLQILPDLVRQMFTAAGRRGMMPVVLKLIEQIFRPVQSAIFLARPAEGKLKLADGRGLPASVSRALEVDYEQGRVGHVARNRLTMDEGDFASVGATDRLRMETTAIKDLKSEVVAAIEYEEGLLGVLSMGGGRSRLGQEKRLLRMIADLTALAMVHVGRLKDTQHTADIDGLTGTYNKRYFQTRLGDEIHKAERENGHLSLFILDIDHFKNYNDTSGHLEGDEVLKKIGQILKSSVREDDVVARYGGEEFVVLFPGATKALAYRLAQALRRSVETHSFAHGARQPLGKVTISGGVAAFPEDAQNAVELLRSADQALYEAKADGRNRILGAAPSYLT